MTSSPQVERVDILSVSGGYWTGASAVVDLLAEHQDAVVVEGEFMLFSFGQFFSEVTSALLRGEPLSPAAHRTLWRYRQFNRPERLSILRRVARRTLAVAGIHPASLTVARTAMARRLGRDYALACEALDDAVRAASRRDRPSAGEIASLVEAVLRTAVLGALPSPPGRRIVGVFDQLVAPPFEVEARAVLPGLKCIVVDRDWRDQYLSMRPAFRRMDAANRRLGVRPWDEDRETDARGFRAAFLALRARIDAARRRADAARTLWITFEEVVSRPDEAARRVFEFAGLDPAQWRRGQRFAPEISRKRVGKWRAPALQGSPVLAEIAELSPILGSPSGEPG